MPVAATYVSWKSPRIFDARDERNYLRLPSQLSEQNRKVAALPNAELSDQKRVLGLSEQALLEELDHPVRRIGCLEMLTDYLEGHEA